jgi:hypothetical protein
MLALVWYPLDYFKLTFGKQDSFKILALNISENLTVDNSLTSKTLFDQINEKLKPGEAETLAKQITDILKRYVCHRFLTPFFKVHTRGLDDGKINTLIKNLTNDPLHNQLVPYTIEKDGIRLNAQWSDYFLTHQYILKGFIKWHLIKFLQKHNPSVVGLSEKLEKPYIRDLKLANGFWKDYLTSNETTCIYSKHSITKANLSLDHFVPWSYVAHDQLWNIVPTTKTVNSSKCDTLPSLEKYGPGFCQLQYLAMSFHSNNGAGRYLDDYYSLIGSEDLKNVSYETFANRLNSEIEANIRVAKKIGFLHPFIWQETPKDQNRYR